MPMLLVLMLIVAVGAMTACTAKKEAPAPESSAPAETQSPEADSTEPESWETAAAEAIDGACTQCHDADHHVPG